MPAEHTVVSQYSQIAWPSLHRRMSLFAAVEDGHEESFQGYFYLICRSYAGFPRVFLALDHSNKIALSPSQLHLPCSLDIQILYRSGVLLNNGHA